MRTGRDLEEDRRGDKPFGLAIGMVTVAAFVLLHALIVVLFYVFANVFALVEGTDFSSDTMNTGAFFAGLAMTVAVLLVLVFFAIGRIGRSLSPKRQRDR